MQRIVVLLIALVSLVFSLETVAKPVDLVDTRVEVNGEYVQVLQENEKSLDLTAVLLALKKNKFQFIKSGFLNFGIGTRPVWLHINVNNRTAAPIQRRLSIKTAWLDHLSVYYLHNGELVKEVKAGDALPFDNRKIKSRYFDFDHDFTSGFTELLIRVETPDPMALPIFLYDIEVAHTESLLESYIYAFVYGILFALSVYNLILFFCLKSIRYLFYTFYLIAFLLMNLAYTGHGYQWLWPGSAQWQLWSNPILMVLFALSGLLFASSFLNTRVFLSRQHRWVVIACSITAVLILFSFIFNSPVSALLVAFVVAIMYGLTIVLLGTLSLCSGNRSAKFFLIASVTHVCTAIITAMTVWGIIPYTVIGFHAIEYGMAIDAILLSLALSDQLRIINEAKLNAERLAMTDHLTGINNRRAFYELVKPIWNTCLRKQRDMSVLIMDIDNFKVINDKFGHSEGDKALKILSRALYDSARSGDIIARWGGEEFILFLPETNLEAAADIAERLREIIETTDIQLDSTIINLTVSIGVAHNKATKITIDELVTIADTFLYKAKDSGRNRVCYKSEEKLIDSYS